MSVTIVSGCVSELTFACTLPPAVDTDRLNVVGPICETIATLQSPTNGAASLAVAATGAALAPGAAVWAAGSAIAQIETSSPRRRLASGASEDRAIIEDSLERTTENASAAGEPAYTAANGRLP